MIGILHCVTVLVFCNLFIVSCKSWDALGPGRPLDEFHSRFFIPTLDRFVELQSQSNKETVSVNDGSVSNPQQPFSGWGWGHVIPQPVVPPTQKPVTPAPTVPPNPHPHAYWPPFFGGTFGLGFGFGGGWYPSYFPYPVYPSGASASAQASSNAQSQSQTSQGQSSASSSASAAASSSSGFFLQQPPPSIKPPTITLPLSYPGVPTILQPSQTGWETSYSVPCGTYTIKPFVIAKLRFATNSSPREKRSSSQHFPFDGYNNGYFRQDELPSNANNGNGNERHLFPFPTFWPPFPHPQPSPQPPPPTNPPKGETCSWNFNSDGTCKLKFKCIWFQLPALLTCSENSLQVTDSTPFLNQTFCGNRRPRQEYLSSSERLILTFRSQARALPAVLDCAVTCSLQIGGGALRPSTKLITAEESLIVPTSTEFGDFDSLSLSPQKNVLASSTFTPNKKTRMRMGDCKCGVREDANISKGRIVGGSPVIPTEFSWAVALVRKPSQVSGGGIRPFCSGTLISDRYVITAGHCVSNNKIIREPRNLRANELFDVILLDHDVSREDDVAGGSLRISVDKIIVHPDYDNVTFNNDVALLRLKHPLHFSGENPNSIFRRKRGGFDFHRIRFLPEVEARPPLATPSPICLPLQNEDEGKEGPAERNLDDRYATVTGWGLTQEGGVPSDVLLKATVQIFNNTLCRDVYREYNYPITESMMCAGYLGGGVDACIGDSGSGLMLDEDGQYYLAGMTSWGRGCGRKSNPGVYTKISPLIDWILEEAKDGIWCHP